MRYGTGIREQIDSIKAKEAVNAEFKAIEEAVLKISGVVSSRMWEDMLIVKVTRGRLDTLDVAALEDIDRRLREWGLRSGVRLEC